jgi:hypothetical protein
MAGHLNMNVVNATQKLPQTQASLQEQLVALQLAAVKLGLYDAADWLKARV